MKTTILLLAVIMAASHSTGQDYDTGAYIHDNSGAYVQDNGRSDDSNILFTQSLTSAVDGEKLGSPPFEWAPGCKRFKRHPLCHPGLSCFDNSDPLCHESQIGECLLRPNQCKCRQFIYPGHPLSNPIHWQRCDL